MEDQYEKLYGENGILTAKLQRNRKPPAVKSIIKTAGRSGSKLKGPCGTCSSCKDTKICNKCPGCSRTRDGRCAFLSCLVFDYETSTLSTFATEAKSAKTGVKRLEKKFTELYGDSGVFVTKLKSVEGTLRDEAPKRGQRSGARCGNCASCTSPMKCGTCVHCFSDRKEGCVFAFCLSCDYSETAISKAKVHANQAKEIDERLEDQYDKLYGSEGTFAIKLMGTTEPKGRFGKEIKSRCGTCVSCTTTMRCHKCQPCKGVRDGACVFHPCLRYEYEENTLTKYRKQAQALKTGDTHLEDHFERIYGEQGLLARQVPLIHASDSSSASKVAKAPRIPFMCHDCTSCCSPITCRICVRCNKATKCVFSICQKYPYKDTRMTMYKKWAQQALVVYADNKLKMLSKLKLHKQLKVRFDEIFSRGPPKAKRRTAAHQFPIGTRVSAIWPKNNVSGLLAITWRCSFFV